MIPKKNNHMLNKWHYVKSVILPFKLYVKKNTHKHIKQRKNFCKKMEFQISNNIVERKEKKNNQNQIGANIRSLSLAGRLMMMIWIDEWALFNDDDWMYEWMYEMKQSHTQHRYIDDSLLVRVKIINHNHHYHQWILWLKMTGDDDESKKPPSLIII